MSAGPNYRPALGQFAAIGTLYNARTDAFLSTSLFNKELPPDGLMIDSNQQQSAQVSNADTFEDKFDKLGISTELGASILAGQVTPGGSSHYLTEKQESNHELRTALYHKIVVVVERLNPMSTGVIDCLATNVLSDDATHVVTGIEWGAQTVVTSRLPLSDTIDPSIAETTFREDMQRFHSALEQSQIDICESGRADQSQASRQVSAYSDMLPDNYIMLENFEEAYKFIEVIPLHITDENGGKGKAIGYTLLPITMLPFILPAIQLQGSSPPAFASVECLRSFVRLFDQFQASHQTLREYHSYISKHKLYLPPGYVKKVSDMVGEIQFAEATLKSASLPCLQDVRNGKENPDKLWSLVRDSTPEHLGPQSIVQLMDGHREKIDFVSMAVAKGAAYIGYNGKDLTAAISTVPTSDIYIFLFSDRSRGDADSWDDNQRILAELLDDQKQKKAVFVVDCDALANDLDKSRIIHLHDRNQVTNDLREHRQFLADKCFARCGPDTLDTSKVPKPLKRRFMKIACPGRTCSPGDLCDWACPQCLTTLEYGYSDRYVYCDCGRSLYSNYDFKCKSKSHGTEFVRFEPDVLLSMLKSLDSASHLNILILGETGVGKSTFINAFVNYLTFETLDEAMKAERLNWVIPCSFSTQVMDRSRPDGQIQQTEVKVGDRTDENDGSKGQSATQQTMVYPIMLGASTIRLIDTPGIGDTRGLEYDRMNMADILSTLSSYDELHGVLILLKSNNARLTVNFSFCVKELLTHLHRNAARNVAFGFTNTRISNYTPGDTLRPLQTLLADHLDIGLGLKMDTTYCFDSESFRYLAAAKNGVVMDNEEDFRRSWKHSRDEAWRLVDHFKSRTPHIVSSTISLNGTRELISELTKPMAEISQLIQTNIALLEDEIHALKDKRISGDKLRKRLHMQKIQLKAQDLDKPRTVCSHSSCTEVRDDGNGEDKKVTLYKAHCHATCYLSDVKADQLAHPGLINCAAFSGTNYCQSCTHHWQEHMHVLYELHEQIATVKDSEIERQLRVHADDLTLKQTAIRGREQTIQEYKMEQEQIQKAAAHFGFFLKKWSIRPYNDATIAYLKVLIKDEEAKVGQGGSTEKLESLKFDLTRYQQLIDVLEESMTHDPDCKPLDEAGVNRLVKELYNLKHFGKNLRLVKQTTAAAHRATYREMPYRVKSQSSWSWSPLQGLLEPVDQSSHYKTRSKSSSYSRQSARRNQFSTAKGSPRSGISASSNHAGASPGLPSASGTLRHTPSQSIPLHPRPTSSEDRQGESSGEAKGEAVSVSGGRWKAPFFGFGKFLPRP